ncbi:MAG: tetratricopeptide repeat protein [Geobacteraceae bacterium]|jgi:tetratricopeptide (TPR) repeat protein
MIKFLHIFAVTVALCLATASAHSQSNGIEWNILNQEVESLYHKGEYDRAVAVAGKALELAERNVEANHLYVATALNNLALHYYTKGRYTQAEPLYKRSLAIREKALSPDHPKLAMTLEKMAILYWNTGRGKDAEALEKRAAAIRKNIR